MIKALNEVLLGWRNKYCYETLQNRGEENGMEKLHPNEGIQSLKVLLLFFGVEEGGTGMVVSCPSPRPQGLLLSISTLFNPHL